MSFTRIDKNSFGKIGINADQVRENPKSAAAKKSGPSSADAQTIQEAYAAISRGQKTTPHHVDFESLFADLKDLDKGKTGV